ncbi:MAG: DNA mismatch repair endonuclease MutL [Aminipila sp.]
MIKLLSKNVADKIAAGEVVDRPLSIVKELVENAIDAGSTSITIEIKNGGKSYIRVTDNGLGIDENEVELAFLRHATSKISTDEDLNSIMTLGFRGEALSSIAAVSRVELITKTAQAKVGTSLKIYGGEVFEKTATGCPEGTTIIVSDLFYNTPARLKFMKTDATESTLIIDFVSKIALAYANIKIRLINNGTILFSTNGKGDKYSNIVTVFSRAVGDGLIFISAENERMSLEGYISRPDFSRTNRKQQIFFVNGRVISNRIMDMAVQDGYTERLFEGRYPIAYLFFNIKPELVDVNIHPNKKEVRFHGDMEVKGFIAQAIKAGLLSNEAIPKVKSENIIKKMELMAQNTQRNQQNSEVTKGIQHKSENNAIISDRETINRNTNVLDKNTIDDSKDRDFISIKSDFNSKYDRLQEKKPQLVPIIDININKHSENEQNNSNIVEILSKNKQQLKKDEKNQEQVDVKSILSTLAKEQEEQEYNNLKNKTVVTNESSSIESFFTTLKILGTLFNTYIMATDYNSFYLIDQHAAHERIFYELLLKQYKNEEKIHQQILTPIVVDVPYSIKSTESSWIKILKGMGFEIEPFGNKSYIVKEIPMFMGLSEAQDMVNYFIENIGEDIDIENQSKIDKIITKACKSAVKANDVLSDSECENLMKDLSMCDNPYSCPHGRPTFIKMTKYEIEKMFKRV